MDFVPDYDLAHKQVMSRSFNMYSSAYVVTNEDLRTSMNLMPKNCENALVVAASGDHPLFCSLFGAKHVDTFDISYNAKCIMDIKVAALNCLNYTDYKQFLGDLYTCCNSDSENMINVKNMDKILCRLPKTESYYIHSLKTEPLFSCGPSPILSGVLPTFTEYCILRKKIVKPYNFFMTNVSELEKYLKKSYDFIHLSNIFDYVIEDHYKTILLTLMQHLNHGGRIVMDVFDEDSSFVLWCVCKDIEYSSSKGFSFKKLQSMNILERTR